MTQRGRIRVCAAAAILLLTAISVTGQRTRPLTDEVCTLKYEHAGVRGAGHLHAIKAPPR